MSGRIEKAIIELESAIRADSHPQAYFFEMRVTPDSSDFVFHNASNAYSERYNLRREEMKPMEAQVTP